MPDVQELTIRVADFDEVKAIIDTLKAERDALAFRVSALREGLQDVMGVDPRSDAMWFIADNALKVDDDRARQALASMERGQA